MIVFCKKKPLANGQPSYLFARIVIFLSIIFAILSLPPTAQSTPTNTGEKKVSDVRVKIRRLQHGISQHKLDAANNQIMERKILAELEIIDKKLVKQVNKLKKLKGNIQRQQILIDTEAARLRTIRTKKKTVEKHLEKRITAYYTMGKVGFLNVTFSTKTLSELLFFHDSFDRLVQYDKNVVDVYRETIDKIERIATALNLEQLLLEDFLDQATQGKKALEETKDEKNVLLSHVRTQTKLRQRAIVEMEQATDKLVEAIIEIKAKNQDLADSFVKSKGSLPPPVDGLIVTQFQQKMVNELSISRQSQGINLQATDGTEIIAISDGDVIFSRYLRGYGNTVIIHHGFQYYTVTARIDKLLVTKGQKVKQEETIGIMGDTATLFDDGLYFEVRHGKDSVDPLPWLDPDRLVFTP